MGPLCLDSVDDYTVGWIAALSNERTAATAMLEVTHKRPRIYVKAHNDTNAYSWGSIGEHNVVIASLPAGHVGTVSAATTAANMLATFPNIRIGLMVGIGAGIPRLDGKIHRDIRLGDVAVSQPEGTSGGVIQYDLGKVKPDGKFERKGYLSAPPMALLSALGQVKTNDRLNRYSHINSLVDDMLDRYDSLREESEDEAAYTRPDASTDRFFESSYQHQTEGADCSTCDQSRTAERPVKRKGNEPKVFYGTIASGNKVVKDAKAREVVVQDAGQDCICIEMEAAGLMNSFPCLVIRGICDYADSHKNDIWHNYAATTAAAYARELLETIDVSDVQKTPKASETMKDDKPKPAPVLVDKAETGPDPADEIDKLRKRVDELSDELKKLRECEEGRFKEVVKFDPNKVQATGPHIQCGHDSIFRKPDGSGTPIYFNKPFKRAPVVSVTIRFYQSSYFYNQRAYLLQDQAFAASTPEYFIAGCWGGDVGNNGGVGNRIEFDWIAVEPSE